MVSPLWHWPLWNVNPTCGYWSPSPVFFNQQMNKFLDGSFSVLLNIQRDIRDWNTHLFTCLKMVLETKVGKYSQYIHAKRKSSGRTEWGQINFCLFLCFIFCFERRKAELGHLSGEWGPLKWTYYSYKDHLPLWAFGEVKISTPDFTIPTAIFRGIYLVLVFSSAIFISYHLSFSFVYFNALLNEV